MVTLYFTARRNIGSALIRLFTWSRWSHICIADGEHIIEAHGWYGVRRVPRDTALHGASRVDSLQVDCTPGQARAVLDAVRSQVGKGYDYGAIVSFLLRRDWQDGDRWMFESVAWGFDQAGVPIFRGEEVARITPAHWWLLNPLLVNRQAALL